ncbi:T9SS type A sorting domain-containing protein [Gaetbulibacter sp. M240]|uniref:T9SS type A sorting domain-containing protein n=1 Tax=Gaetbulibacter sp. M240 TaxID=3126511 RepID=UPI00374E87AB
MKQKTTFLIYLIFALLTVSVSAQTVNIEGDPYGGNPYASITAAIDASNDGDVILIDGIHTEPITIFNKSITLRGSDPTTDIIQAANSAASDGSGQRVISILASSVDPDPLPVLNVTIENLGVRYGNEPSVANENHNGGGIDADKITGLLTLKNLIIEDNYTAELGGGLSIAGSNADIIECTIRNNSCAKSGGGIILAPNNGAGINSTINFKQSLIDSNTGVSGGGIYINGNPDFGDDYTIDVNIENSTISNNSATSGQFGAGGGAIWTKGATWTTNAGGDGSSGNVTLKLIHNTIFNNIHTGTLVRSGVRFTGTATSFSAFNSIIVAFDDTTRGALDFANSNTTNVINCILGTVNAAPAIVGDAGNNNQIGSSATDAGLTGTLTSDGGSTQVIPLAMSSMAVDYCTVATGETIPTIDQRGYGRTDGTNDAGAYEYGATTLSIADNEFDNGLKLFPNPAREFVTISSLKKIKQVKVYSILGVLENTFYDQNELNISGLSKGVHLLSIEADDSSRSTRRLIVY